jgi:hypothetical protein
MLRIGSAHLDFSTWPKRQKLSDLSGEPPWRKPKPLYSVPTWASYWAKTICTVDHDQTTTCCLQRIKTSRANLAPNPSSLRPHSVETEMRERERGGGECYGGDPVEREMAAPLMSPLTDERHSPEGECIAVESSHDGSLSRLLNQNLMRSDLMMAAKRLQHGGDPELLGGDKS